MGRLAEGAALQPDCPLGMTRRVVSALIAMMTVAVMLLTFQAMRTIGAGLLASAGILGIVAGIATLRFEVREQLLAYLRDRHPTASPVSVRGRPTDTSSVRGRAAAPHRC